MEPNDLRRPAVSRRQLLAGTGAGAAALVVAACSSDETGSSAKPSPASKSAAGSGSPSEAESPAGSGESLASVADVPVGGAVSAEDSNGKPVIVSQPAKGDLVAFSAICTHMGCTVAPQGDQLVCPCHGSTYDLATGDNTGGPAPKPLAKIPVKVQGGEVVEA